jgi:hypothetical protein
MKLELEPRFLLHVEGDNSRILNALREAGLTSFYEHFLADRMLICEDDPDAGVIGSLPISTMTQLGSLLPVVMVKAKAQCSLFISGGDKQAGFSIYFGDGQPHHETGAEWHADSSLFSKKISEVAEAAKKLLDELLTT